MEELAATTQPNIQPGCSAAAATAVAALSLPTRNKLETAEQN